MDLADWWAVPPLNLLAFWGEGVWLNITAFAPLCKLLVEWVGQVDRPDPDATQYF